MNTDSDKTISRIDLSLVDNVDMVGRAIADRWQVVRLLGQGRMSTLYEAEEEHSPQSVVLKLVHKQILQGVSDLKMLLDKARIFTSLRHDHISNFHDIYLSDNGELFLCCKYFEADSLENILAAEGRMSVERAIKINLQVTEALSYAHKQNILHKDIKPSNLRVINNLGKLDYVQVVDFGISRLISEKIPENSANSDKSDTLEKYWDVTYLSPEQCLNGKVDVRSDIYSLGCVMYECLNGSPPFSVGNLMETVYKHAYAFPDPINAPLEEGNSLDRYQAIVMKMLEKSPSDRYQSMSALKTDLDLILIATDEEWNANALAAKFPAKRISPKEVGKISPRTVWLGLAIVGIVTVLTLAANHLITGHKNDQTLSANSRLLWALKEKQATSSIKDFAKKKNDEVFELTSIEQAGGKSSPLYEATLYNFCNLLMLGTDWSGAIAALKELLEVHEKAKGPIDPSQIHSSLALCYFAKGYLETAETECQLVIKEYEQGKAKSMDAVISAMNILGDIYTQRSDDSKAKGMYLNLYKIAGQAKLKWPPVFSFACARLADSYRRLGDYENASQYYKESVDWWQNYVGGKGTFLPRALYGYGLVLAEKKEYAQALQRQKEALPLAMAAGGPNTALIYAIKKLYNDCLFHTDFKQWLSTKFGAQDGPK